MALWKILVRAQKYRNLSRLGRIVEEGKKASSASGEGGVPAKLIVSSPGADLERCRRIGGSGEGGVNRVITGHRMSGSMAGKDNSSEDISCWMLCL